MNITTQIPATGNMTIKEGDPFHDERGNVIGHVTTAKHVEDRFEIVVAVDREMESAQSFIDKVMDHQTPLSMGCG